MSQSAKGNGNTGKSAAQGPQASALSNDAWLGEYVALLDRQRALYGELDNLGERQSMLVEGEDLTPLMDLLGERERLIEALGVASRATERLHEQWERHVGGVPEHRRTEVEKRLAWIADLAEKIALRDARHQTRLKSRLSEVSQQLAGLASSRKAVGAYGPAPSPRQPTFQDREG